MAEVTFAPPRVFVEPEDGKWKISCEDCRELFQQKKRYRTKALKIAVAHSIEVHDKEAKVVVLN